MPCPVAFSIAGSDPSGGAGVQADLKTFCRLGVYGAAAITCITVQDTRGVQRIHCLEAELVADQVRAVLHDLPVSHIKTGMLGSTAIVRQLGNILAQFRGEVIVDPVLISSSGHPLLAPEAMDILLRHFLPAATVLTPNLPELTHLAGRPSFDSAMNENDLLTACATLFARAPRLRAICVTGGHARAATGEVVDRLVLRAPASAGRPVVAARHTHPRLTGEIGHGTGCTFAAAFTAYHLRLGDDARAFARAAGLVADLLAASPPLGRGTAPLAHHLQGAADGIPDASFAAPKAASPSCKTRDATQTGPQHR